MNELEQLKTLIDQAAEARTKAGIQNKIREAIDYIDEHFTNGPICHQCGHEAHDTSMCGEQTWAGDYYTGRCACGGTAQEIAADALRGGRTLAMENALARTASLT